MIFLFIFRHNGSRLFLGLFIFIAFVLTTAYKGNLLALLTVKTFPEPVHDFEGLAKWVKVYLQESLEFTFSNPFLHRIFPLPHTQHQTDT